MILWDIPVYLKLLKVNLIELLWSDMEDELDICGCIADLVGYITKCTYMCLEKHSTS